MHQSTATDIVIQFFCICMYMWPLEQVRYFPAHLDCIEISVLANIKIGSSHVSLWTSLELKPGNNVNSVYTHADKDTEVDYTLSHLCRWCSGISYCLHDRPHSHLVCSFCHWCSELFCCLNVKEMWRWFCSKNVVLVAVSIHEPPPFAVVWGHPLSVNESSKAIVNEIHL